MAEELVTMLSDHTYNLYSWWWFVWEY